MTGQRHRTADHVGVSVAYGLVAGAALGVMLLAFTGDVLWISMGGGLGLVVGSVVGGLLAGRRGRQPDRSGDDTADEVT